MQFYRFGGNNEMNIGGLNAISSAMRSGFTGMRSQSTKRQNLVQNSTADFAYVGTLKIGGLASRALPDGSNVTVYKADSYTKDNPLLRVVTTLANGTESEQIIDPLKVDVSNATENEMFALNSYLVNEGKLNDDVYNTGMFTDSGVSDTKKNFTDILKNLMDMQYKAHNISGYAKYNTILSAYVLLGK